MQDRPESQTEATSQDADADGLTGARNRRVVLRAALIGGPVFLTLRAARAQETLTSVALSNNHFSHQVL